MIFYTFSDKAFSGTGFEGLVSGVRVAYIDDTTGRVMKFDTGTTDPDSAEAREIELGKNKWISEIEVWRTSLPAKYISAAPCSFVSRIRMVISSNTAAEPVVIELGKKNPFEFQDDSFKNIRVLKFGFDGGPVLDSMTIFYAEDYAPFRVFAPSPNVHALFDVKFETFELVKSKTWNLCKAAMVASSVGLTASASLELWLSFNDSFDFTFENSGGALEVLKKAENESVKEVVQIKADHVMLLVGGACLKSCKESGSLVLIPCEEPTWEEVKVEAGELAKYSSIVDLVDAVPFFKVTVSEWLPTGGGGSYCRYNFTK